MGQAYQMTMTAPDTVKALHDENLLIFKLANLCVGDSQAQFFEQLNADPFFFHLVAQIKADIARQSQG